MKYILIAIMAAAIGFGVSNQYCPKYKTVLRTDTITVIPEPIIIEKIAPKLVYRSDTVIVTRPFTATVDTVFNTDTIRVRYDYPENEMQLAIRMATDTVYQQRLEVTECDESEWWEAPAIATGGMILGILISNTSK
jgi:hypothetical protein